MGERGRERWYLRHLQPQKTGAELSVGLCEVGGGATAGHKPPGNFVFHVELNSRIFLCALLGSQEKEVV